MRTDHLAYQQATRVAGFGLLLQLGIGLVMLAYGFIFADTTFQIASMPILVGGVVWVSLVIVFHQHRLERLEALDERKAEVVKLRVFWGMEMSEIADTLGVSVPTITRDWRFARTWLAAELEGAA